MTRLFVTWFHASYGWLAKERRSLPGQVRQNLLCARKTGNRLCKRQYNRCCVTVPVLVPFPKNPQPTFSLHFLDGPALAIPSFWPSLLLDQPLPSASLLLWLAFHFGHPFSSAVPSLRLAVVFWPAFVFGHPFSSASHCLRPAINFG